MRLIDADELRRCAIPCEIHNGALTDLCVPLYQIDNAQTIEPLIDYSTNEQLYRLIILAGQENTRSQGEWLWLCDTPDAKYKWSCNKCGRGVKEQENFCPNCGVQMQKVVQNGET